MSTRPMMPAPELDRENMLGFIHALPDQLETAWALGLSLPLPVTGKIERIVIAGMGGSAIGGDLLASYCRDRCQIPIVTHRDYELPAWATGPETLVICSSHSGNTEETLSAFQAAKAGGCSLLTLSTGGKLVDAAGKTGVANWLFEHDGQPRTAVAFSFGMLLALVERLGLVSGSEKEIRSAISVMHMQRQTLGRDVDMHHNPAKRLAGQLTGKYISIFAAGSMEVVARRWKTQFNELAKAWAQFEGLPEADHNTLVATINPEELVTKVAAIFLRSEMDHPRNQLRLAATREAFMLDGLTTDEVWAKGDTRLAQMWTLLQMGDYVAYYLALMYGIDPTPVEALARLKEKLSSL
jgi:glucose/mannose-6-phosphate isomerase